MAQPSLNPADLPLRDIHLPPEIGYWPVAYGWWLLLATLVFVCLGGLSFWRYRQRRALRRLALAQLDALQDLSGIALATALSSLLRRAAISHFSTHEVAGLTAESWLAFLDQPFDDHPFTEGVGRVLADAPYRLDVSVQDHELRELCRQWLQKLPPLPLSFWRGR